MLHEPSIPTGPDPAAGYKARLGIWMFFLYLILYAGFVAINLVKPQWMGEQVLLGMNLATVYGFGLIGGALVQALIYNAACKAREKAARSQDQGV